MMSQKYAGPADTANVGEARKSDQLGSSITTPNSVSEDHRQDLRARLGDPVSLRLSGMSLEEIAIQTGATRLTIFNALVNAGMIVATGAGSCNAHLRHGGRP